MQSLKVEGSARIAGRVRIGGNKNAALPMIAALLLTDEEVVLDNVPDILDVRTHARHRRATRRGFQL